MHTLLSYSFPPFFLQVAVKQLQKAVIRLGQENAALTERLWSPAPTAEAPAAESAPLPAQPPAPSAEAEADRLFLQSQARQMSNDLRLLKAVCKLAVSTASDLSSGKETVPSWLAGSTIGMVTSNRVERINMEMLVG